jgi:hypothetical protein
VFGKRKQTQSLVRTNKTKTQSLLRNYDKTIIKVGWQKEINT